MSARGKEVYGDFLWGWRGWWAPFLHSISLACNSRLAHGPTIASRLTSPCPHPTQAALLTSHKEDWQPRGPALLVPYGIETIGKTVTGSFPHPRVWHRGRTKTHPQSSWEKGLLAYPKGHLQVCHTSRDCVGAPGEYRSSVTILALALGLYTAPRYLLERGLSTHLEHQFLPLLPMDISTSPALGASKGLQIWSHRTVYVCIL